jgi:putative transposase
VSDRTFFITSPSYRRRNIFQSRRMQELFIEVLRDHRQRNKFLLHAFVLMPDHMHLLMTPVADVALEKAVQLIKGTYSFRAHKEFGIQGVWAAGFNKDRVKSVAEYDAFENYIHFNPVKLGLVASPELYECSSAWLGRRMDPSPFARAKAQTK